LFVALTSRVGSSEAVGAKRELDPLPIECLVVAAGPDVAAHEFLGAHGREEDVVGPERGVELQ
jgi:hypothetical protein